MNKLPEPDDVECFVGGVEPDAGTSIETVRLIEEYKKRPDYRLELEEAERILADLGISARAYGMQDAKSLLDHWHRCIHDLQQADLCNNDGGRADQENIGVDTG